MTATIQTLTRRFRFGATVLEDIDPQAAPEDILKLYTPSYPFLAHASLGEPVVEGDTLVFPIEKKAVQTKGARAKSSLAAACAALDAWEASSTQALPHDLANWSEVSDYVQTVIGRPETPLVDAMLVPML